MPWILIWGLFGNFCVYQSIPHFKITLDINVHWNQRTLKFRRFCRRPFWKWRPFARDFFLVRIFYQPSLIFMPSFVEIPLAVSDISEVEDFDIRSRFPWQRRPFWKFQDWMHLLRCGSTFLWSLVKIGSLVSENLVGQAHSEKRKNNNNN
jgi:hypothetical protein